VFAALGLGIVSRLFYIQVLHNSDYAAESRKQAQQRVLLCAKRGDIRDRKGRALAASVGSQLTLTATMLASQETPGRPIRPNGR